MITENRIYTTRIKYNWLSLILITISILSTSICVSAQHQNPNYGKGLNSESYLAGDFDNVNLYNRNLTLTIPLGQTYTVGGNLNYRFMLAYNSNAWSYKSELQIGLGEYRTQAEPNPKANAGHGWMLSLGALYPPEMGFYNTGAGYLYVSPDGSEHEFGGSAITNDGTYLRLKHNPDRVEFPDGTVHYFNPTTRQVSKIEDRFGNKVEVDTSSPVQWVIREKCATSCANYTRTHRVNFTTNDGVKWRVWNVQLAAFNGTTARYDFDYGTSPVPTRRDNIDDWQRIPPVPNVDLWMLNSVKLPANAGSYKFDYFRWPPDYGVTNPGVIVGATLPTGAYFRWDWQTSTRPIRRPDDPQVICNPYCPDGVIPVSLFEGVSRKRIYNSAGDYSRDPNSDHPIGVYVYDDINGPGQAPTHDNLRGYATTVVKNPEGNETVNYFNLDFIDGDPFPDATYSLPFSTVHSLPVNGQTLYLSQEIYKGTRTNGTKLRSVYVKYDTDGTGGEGRPFNPRVVAQHVIYHDDGGKVSSTFNSEWNGMGQFRQTKTSGFGATGEKGIYTDYDNTFPGINEPWILNLYTEQKVSENGQTAYAQYCFDNSTGVLKRKRTLKDSNVSNKDIFVVYDRNGDGNVTNERYYGGDKSQNAPTGLICSAAAGDGEYEIVNTYSFGSLATSEYSGLAQNERYFTVNNTIDQNTGLISNSKDSAGVATDYEYDTLGRITKVTPVDDALTEYVYTPANGAAGASVRIERKWGGTSLSVNSIKADPFGRKIEENDPVPDNDGAPTFRRFEYNAMGWQTSVSEYSAANKKTEFSDFDAFGRAQWITAPDGKVSRIIYTGDSSIERRRDISTLVDAAGNVTEDTVNTYETYDRYGRLTGVNEGSGANNSRIVTNYKYDVGNRLSRVEYSTPNSSPPPPARRNVALSSNGGQAQASSTLNGNYPVTATINGDVKGTGWASGSGGWNDATPNVFPDNLEIQFNGVKRINEIDLYTLQDNYRNPVTPTTAMTFTQYGVTAFQIKYWNGATNQWVMLVSVQNNNKVWRKISFTPIQTQKLSITFTGALTNYSRVVEVEAWEAPVTNELEPLEDNGEFSLIEQAELPDGEMETNSVLQQVRTFNYDNRGFLTSETHPEITGTVTYKYDSLGKVTEKVEGNNKLFYAYDKSGRLISITDGNLTRTIKTFKYYKQNEGINSLGKMKKATRVNWVKNPYAAPDSPESQQELDVKISEEYFYTGLGGRLGQRKTTLLDEVPSAAFVFNQSFDYDRLGSLLKQTYPQCENTTCVNSGMEKPRTVNYTYEGSYLKSVGIPGDDDKYASLTYFSNKTINTVTHSNGVTDKYSKDPDSIPRIRNITFSKTGAFAWNWSSGAYEYDGAGNIKKIGTDWYIYDNANRIKEGTAGVDSANRRYKQSYEYDSVGNMMKRTTVKDGQTEVLDMSVDASTNRLNGVLYDNAGNALGVASSSIYMYDPLNMMKYAPGRTYLYGPNEERMWIINKDVNNNLVENITLRGLNNEVLREYEVRGGNAVNNWQWIRDYIYRGTTLLASETRDYGRLEYHPDHLGSARFVSNAQGAMIQSVRYYPYGMEVMPNNMFERLRFTGHERDTNNSPGHTFYYMHARYYGMDQGKFINVDPGRDFDPQEPQSWNRYAYTRGNPINGTDPDGRFVVILGLGQAFRDLMGDPKPQPDTANIRQEVQMRRAILSASSKEKEQEASPPRVEVTKDSVSLRPGSGETTIVINKDKINTIKNLVNGVTITEKLLEKLGAGYKQPPPPKNGVCDPERESRARKEYDDQVKRLASTLIKIYKVIPVPQ